MPRIQSARCDLQTDKPYLDVHPNVVIQQPAGDFTTGQIDHSHHFH